MYISDYLHESIAGGNIRDIRGALLGYVEMDPAFKSSMFLDAIDYTAGLGFSVYENHDQSLFAEEGCSDRDRFYQIETHLHYNFSKERVQELVCVGRRCMQNASVYSVTQTSLESQGNSSQPRNAVTTKQGEDSTKKSVGQDQRMVTNHIWVMAALVAILAGVIILLVLRKD